MECLAERGSRIGERLRVEPVKKLNSEAQCDDADVEGAKGLGADDFRNVDRFAHASPQNPL